MFNWVKIPWYYLRSQHMIISFFKRLIWIIKQNTKRGVVFLGALMPVFGEGWGGGVVLSFWGQRTCQRHYIPVGSVRQPGGDVTEAAWGCSAMVHSYLCRWTPSVLTWQPSASPNTESSNERRADHQWEHSQSRHHTLDGFSVSSQEAITQICVHYGKDNLNVFNHKWSEFSSV